MPAVVQVLELAQIAGHDAAWKLLRADRAPVIAGLLGTHLGGDERRLDAEVDLVARLEWAPARAPEDLTVVTRAVDNRDRGMRRR